MSRLSLDQIKTLVDQPQGLCVSLYMPTYRAGVETQQNTIRFKNLIKQAEAELQAQGLRSPEIAELLQPAMDLDKEEFWQTQDEGIAIFSAKGCFQYYCLPAKFSELVVVADRFHLKPLMPLLMGDGQFFILELSQENPIRFFEGSRYSVSQVEIPDLPKNMDEVLLYDETAGDGQFRISTSKGGTSNSFQQAGEFHGQGSPDRDQRKNKNILQYFHHIDRVLQAFLHGKQAPLVLTGAEYLMPIYREANTYQHLVEGFIPGNTKILKPEELHQPAWTIVEPHFQQAQRTAVEHYRELTTTGKTSTNLQEAIPAAYYGRVDQLFVAVGVQQWGRFDTEANQLQMHPDAEPGDEDLLNSAAIQTLLNGGTVYAVPPDQVPDEAPLAAVFRY